ncbi:MAG TPA: hypothetical protein VGP17_13295 [Solirubrobacteraceae bacterium]|jgi:hypothetical protein|nr:hypothetical protein [Solirubrobacteraceae bacterium]
MSETVLLSPRGRGDFREDLDDIAAAAREAAPDVEVTVEEPTSMEAGKRGVVWGEVLNVTLSFTGGYLFGKVMDAIVDKASDGWRTHNKPKPRPRPRFVNFYGPDGEVLRQVEVHKEADDDE